MIRRTVVGVGMIVALLKGRKGQSVDLARKVRRPDRDKPPAPPGSPRAQWLRGQVQRCEPRRKESARLL